VDPALAHTVRISQQLWVEFWTPNDWLPYLLDLWICSVLQAKVQATPLANLAALHPYIGTEWHLLTAEYITKTYSSFASA
jgi:hypothetical protein